MKLLTLPLTKKKINKNRERSKNISNFKNINSKTPEKLLLVTLVNNFHKLLLLLLWSDPNENLKNKNWF